MAINVNVTERKVFNEFKNGISFSNSPSDFTRNLTGSVMEKVRILTTYDVEVVSILGQPNRERLHSSSFDGNVLIIDKNDGVNWNEDGFFVGQSVYVLAEGGGSSQVDSDRTILEIRGDVIEIDMGFSGYPSPIDPPNFKIYLQTPLTALVYNFGLIENDDNYSSISLVTQNSMGYYGVNVGDTGGAAGFPLWGRLDTFIDLEKLGKFNDFVTGNARARFVGGNDTNTNQTFEVEHTLVINPFYLDGELSDLKRGILPDFLDGTNSLKYVNKAEWREVLNNPNRSYSITDDNEKGSVAWFDESFNGFNNNYNIDSIEYEEDATGAEADGIIVSGRTKIIITISKKSGSLISGDRFGVYISYLPIEEDYKNVIETNLLQNFIYDRALSTADNASPVVGDDFIQSITSQTSGGILTIECIVEYSNEQKAFLSQRLKENIGNYVIGIQAGDKNLSSGNSDRVILKAVGTFDQNADIDGLISIENMLMFPHNESIASGEGFTNMTSWNEDGLVSTFDLKLDLNKQALFNNLSFALIAYNDTTKDFFILNESNIDLSNSPISGGVQQIEIDSNRGYILKDNSQFNFLKITTGTNAAGIQTYNCSYAQKIAWQEWIENLNVNEVFINTSEPNNNQNLKSSNYSLKEGYTIRLAVISNLFGVSDLGVSGDTDYLQISQPITTYDYEEDGNVTPEWSAEIKTRRLSNNEDLLGAILTDESTIFETIWTNSNGAVLSTDGIWTIHRIEETDQAGFNITELSSINEPLENQTLIPLQGETLLDMAIESGNIVTRCLIDGEKIEPSVSYNLSSRIHNGITTNLPFKVTSPSSEIKDTSGTVESKIEAT